MTATPAAQRSDTARALRVRARADLAANVVAPYYGLDAAIAVNPVLPALGDGFAAAVSSAAPALGGRGVLPEHEFRAHLAAGRIGAAELAASIRRHRAGTPGDDAALVARFLAEAPAGPATARADAADAAADAPLDPIDELVAGWCPSTASASTAPGAPSPAATPLCRAPLALASPSCPRSPTSPSHGRSICSASLTTSSCLPCAPTLPRCPGGQRSSAGAR